MTAEERVQVIPHEDDPTRAQLILIGEDGSRSVSECSTDYATGFAHAVLLVGALSALSPVDGVESGGGK